MRSKIQLLYLVALGCFFIACSKNKETIRPIPPEPDPASAWVPKALNDVRKLYLIYSIGFLTAGSIQYESNLKFENWLPGPPLTPDLGRILPQGDVVNLITIGGGLTAGAQGGGLFRDGQLAAYPNLVAKQLGMVDFKTPLFDGAHANGTGFIVANPDKSQTFYKIINNLGTVREEENGKPLQLSPYVGKTNNYAAPWLSTYRIFNANWEESYIGKVGNANGVSWPPFLPYAARFIPIDHFANGTLFNYITDHHPYNFFILEDAAEEFLNVLRLKGSRVIGLSDFNWDLQEGDYVTLKAIQRFKTNGSNGVVFTVPHYKYLGISTWNTQAINQHEIDIYEKAADIKNNFIVEWAKSNDVALVDLNDLYKKVSEGKITIGQNTPVSRKFDGNFFSSDGIYPSTLGQAFVANEVIKAINLQFKSKVELIDIEKYLKTIGFAY